MSDLFIFGIGYSAQYVVQHLEQHAIEKWRVSGTVRGEEKAQGLVEQGVQAYAMDAETKIKLSAEARNSLQNASHIFVTIPPTEQGCPVARWMEQAFEAGENFPNLKWLGYCSSTGVYGDAYGKWVDETTPPAPVSASGKRRLIAEQQWLALHEEHGIPAHIFRIAGIYGPQRNAMERVRKGMEQVIYAPDHFISRIHVEDIAQGVTASTHAPSPGDIYNLADDTPAPLHVPIEHAAELLNVSPPPRIPIADAELSDFAKGMFKANKRVSSVYIQEKLGFSWYYSSYKDGLTARARHFSAS